MYILPILFLVLLSTLQQVSSKSQHLAGDEDIFEDALLEHFRDIRDDEVEEEDDGDVYYRNENDEEDDHNLSRSQLIKVLDVIKREAHKRREKLKKSIENQHNNKRSQQKEKKLNEEANKPKTPEIKNENANTKKDNVKVKDNQILNIETEKKDENDGENSQVASVEIDNSLEKQTELINKVNIRDILAKDGNTDVSKTPSHAHVKQEKVVSTKANKSGLDRVSFIAVVAGCCVAAIAGIALAAYCWYKLRVETKEDTEANTGTKKQTRSSNRSKKEAKEEKPLSKDDEMNVNASYYNYQHARNQIKQMGQNKPLSDHINGDDEEDDEDDEDTVYECPGLAAPGDMKVVNPMFSDGESRHSDKHSESTSQEGSPTPPNERMESVSQTNNNMP